MSVKSSQLAIYSNTKDCSLLSGTAGAAGASPFGGACDVDGGAGMLSGGCWSGLGDAGLGSGAPSPCTVVLLEDCEGLGTGGCTSAAPSCSSSDRTRRVLPSAAAAAGAGGAVVLSAGLSAWQQQSLLTPGCACQRACKGSTQLAIPFCLLRPCVIS